MDVLTKNGRVIFGELEKFGKVWRMGADEATTITFTRIQNLVIPKIAAGTYTICCFTHRNRMDDRPSILN